MKKLSVSLTFAYEANQSPYVKEFEVEDDFDLKYSEYLSREAFHAVDIGLLYTTYRATLPNFGSFTDKMSWFAPQAGISDLTRFAAHGNTAQVWWQIENSFTEAAHLLSRARAYDDVEKGESDKDRQMYLHLMKIQYFNAAAYLTSKIEDWFLLLLFVNSGCSLIRDIECTVLAG
jgi:carboxylesterase type B